MPKSKKPAVSEKDGTPERIIHVRTGDTSELIKVSAAALAQATQPIQEPLKSTHPAIHKLCDSAIQNGDIEAVRELVKIGLIVSDVLLVAAHSHDNILTYVRGLYTIPVSMPAIAEKADLAMEIVRDIFGFGSELPIKIRKPKGGRSRFKGTESPTQIALDLLAAFEKERPHKDKYYYAEWYASALKVKNTKRFESDFDSEPGERLNAEQMLYFDVVLLPDFKGDDYLTWANVGARVMVDGCSQILGVPPIPDAWRAMAKKRKGKLGALRDIVRNELESGFKAIVPS